MDWSYIGGSEGVDGSNGLIRFWDWFDWSTNFVEGSSDKWVRKFTSSPIPNDIRSREMWTKGGNFYPFPYPILITCLIGSNEVKQPFRIENVPIILGIQETSLS